MHTDFLQTWYVKSPFTIVGGGVILGETELPHAVSGVNFCVCRGHLKATSDTIISYSPQKPQDISQPSIAVLGLLEVRPAQLAACK